MDNGNEDTESMSIGNEFNIHIHSNMGVLVPYGYSKYKVESKPSDYDGNPTKYDNYINMELSSYFANLFVFQVLQ